MNIFTYGTLMDPEIMNGVAGCLPAAVEAVLAGYGRYTVRDEQYPGVVLEEKNQVNGLLYLDVPDQAVQRLDRFEGEIYSREPVVVRVWKEQAVREAMVYLIKPQYQHLLTKTVWDFGQFLVKGKKVFEDHYDGFHVVEGD